MEAVADAGGGKAFEHRGEIADHARRRFVANADHQCDRSRDRLVAADAGGRRRDDRGGIAGKAHDDEADRRIPEADHRPRQRDQEQREQHHVERVEAVDRERMGRKAHQQQRRRQHQAGEHQPSPGRRGGQVDKPGA
jgi:hypothetical protein